VNHSLSTAPLPSIGIIIPACDEEACLGDVLDELLGTVDPKKFAVIVGVNGSSDRTAQIARDRGVLVTETSRRGYGHGCVAAIDLAKRTLPSLRAYIFFAGDGASDPRDLATLVSAHDAGADLVLGARTGRLSNWRTMKFSHVLANFALALWVRGPHGPLVQRSRPPPFDRHKAL
jgi:glycosyltransferase involved in cell wall biosynthesis